MISKCYHYRYYLGRAKPIEAPYLWACREGPIDLAAMNVAAQAMLGEHDFTALSASHGKDVDPNPCKTLYQLQVRQKGPYLNLQVEGSGFLYKMVRSLAGALYAVGRQRLSPDELIDILHSRQRTQKIVTAPAQGLYWSASTTAIRKRSNLLCSPENCEKAAVFATTRQKASSLGH